MKKTSLLLLLVIHQLGFSQEWHEVPTPTTKNLNTIDFPTPDVGYIGGNDSLLLKTTDGGRTWFELAYSGVDFLGTGYNDNILNLKFLSDSMGYMTLGPYSNGAYKTTDGGTTWALVAAPEPQMCYNYGLYFFGEDNGLLGGSGCFGGEDMRHISPDGLLLPATIMAMTLGPPVIVDIDFLDETFGLAVSGHAATGQVFRTTDGGDNWATIESGLAGDMELLTAIEIVNDTLAYISYIASGATNGLLVTHDGGLTWNYDTETATFLYPKFLALHESGDGSIYTGGGVEIPNHGIIFEKTTDDDFWLLHSVEQPINGLSSYSESIVWGVGDSGYVVVNVAPESLQIPTYGNQEIINLYPNPTTGSLTITIANQNSAPQTLSIYNLLGELVSPPSKFSNQIDVSQLLPGIYFIRIENDQGQNHTCRFIKN